MSGSAQSLSYYHYDSRNGLASATVYDALRDHEGYMWFATEQGVDRFDGKNFTHFTTADGLTDNEVLNLYEDTQHRIWLSTLSGNLCFYKDGHIHNPHNDPLLKNASLHGHALKFYENPEGTLFVLSYSNQLIIFDPAFTVQQRIPSPVHLASISFTYQDGKTIIAGDDSIYSYDNGKLIFNRKTKNHPGSVLYVVSDRNRSLFLGYEGLVYSSKPEEYQLILDKESLQLYREYVDQHLINVIREDRNGDIWVCRLNTGAELYRNGKLISTYLQDKNLCSVYIDSENNTWFCTKDEGVYLLTDQSSGVTHYSNFKGPGNSAVTAITVGRDKSIWFGLNNAYLGRLTPSRTVETYQVQGFKVHSHVRSLIESDGKLYGCTDHFGFIRTAEGKYPHVESPMFTAYDRNKDKAYAPKQIYRSGDKIYLTCANFIGYLVEDPVNSVFHSLEGQLARVPRFYCHYVKPDQQSYYVSDNLGTWYYNKNNKPKQLLDASIRVNEIQPLDGEKVIICSEGHGLYVCKKDSVIQHVLFGRQDDLPVLRSVYVTDSVIWTSSNKGLFALKYPFTEPLSYNVYGPVNGLSSATVNNVIILDDTIYIASESGLDAVSLHHLSSGDPSLIFKIYLTVSDSTYNINGNLIRIKADNERLGINLQVLQYPFPTDIHYRYRLNKDQPWTEIKGTLIELAGLTPDYYKPEVSVRVGSANWLPARSIPFILEPHFWQTVTFRIIAAAFFLTVIILVVRKRTSMRLRRQLQLAREQEFLQQERTRIAMDMHDDFGADLTRIFLLGEVIQNTEKEQNRVELRQMIGLTGELRSKMDEIIWALNADYDNTGHLFAYLSDHTYHFFENTAIRVTVENNGGSESISVQSVIRRNIFLSYKEVLQNILKHSKSTDVSIRLSMENNIISIRVEDNGVGFDPEVLLRRRNGMYNLQKRMKRCNGEVVIESRPAVGTVVMMNCPSGNII